KSKERRFKCGYENCGNAFKKLSHLRSHFFKHRPISDYKCSYSGCDATFFRDKVALNRHIRTKHTRERPYKCTLCDRKFIRIDHLKVHM
ncbi:hypothetical protein CAPTEDRAFT_88579, partial [Capitella teleta]